MRLRYAPSLVGALVQAFNCAFVEAIHLGADCA